MRLGRETKTVGTEKVEEMRGWNAGWILWVNADINKDEGSGGSRKKSKG